MTPLFPLISAAFNINEIELPQKTLIHEKLSNNEFMSRIKASKTLQVTQKHSSEQPQTREINDNEGR